MESNSLPKNFKIGEVEYKNDLSEENLKIAADISNEFDLDIAEVLRIILIVSRRVPDVKSDNFYLVKSKHFYTTEEEKLAELKTFYICQLINEQCSFYKICKQLITEVSQMLQSNGTSEYFTTAQVAKLQNLISTVQTNSAKNIETHVDVLKSINDKALKIGQLKNEYPFSQLISLLMDMLEFITCSVTLSENGFSLNTVQKWFNLMKETAYFSDLFEYCNGDTSALTLESLATIFSLVLLDLDFNFGSLDDTESFMNHPDKLNKITDFIVETRANPIILYAWSIILHRKHVVLEMNDTEQKVADFFTSLSSGILIDIENVYTSLANEAEKLNVFKALDQCHSKLKYNSLYSSILGSFTIAFVPYIQPTDESIDTISSILKSSSRKIIERFFTSPDVIKMMVLLKAKMPMSINMFTTLISINANLAVEELRLVNSYMEIVENKVLIPSYNIDDNQPELIKLTSDLTIRPPYELPGELCLMLKKGTKGQILPNTASDDNSLVMFMYDYNGWSLIGRIMKNLSVTLEAQDSEKLETLTKLFKLLTIVVNGSDYEILTNVFDSMNSFIDDQDIIDIAFRIHEQSLHFRNLKLIKHSMSFLIALSENGYSDRVWSFIYKSDFFSMKPNGGLIYDVLGKHELSVGTFDVTITLLKLTLTLLGDTLQLNSHVTKGLKAEVLNSLVFFTVQVFEYFSTWSYQFEEQKYQIGSLSTEIFNRILLFYSGVGNNDNKDSKSSTSVLEMSFQTISGAFLIYDIEDTRPYSSITNMIETIGSSFSDNSNNGLSAFWKQNWYQNGLDFCINLLIVRKSLNFKQQTIFERSIYQLLPKLVSSYLFHGSLKKYISTLLKELMSSPANNEKLSMLTHLGPSHSQILLYCVSQDLTNGCTDDELIISLYDLFAATMKYKQEGLAFLFISGQNIFNTNTKSVILNEKLSLFVILKQHLNDSEKYPSMVLLHILDTLALVLTSSVAGVSIFEDTKYIKKIINLIVEPFNLKENNSIETIYTIKSRAKMIDIITLALKVYNGKNDECTKSIVNQLNSAEFFKSLDSVFTAKGYNASIGDIIKQKFHNKWEGKYTLDQFIVADVHKPNDFNVDLMYNFSLLDHIFNFDKEWPEMKREIVKSGMQVLLNESKMCLEKSYGGLLTCFCATNPIQLKSDYLKVAETLLKITIEEGLSSKLYEIVHFERIELVFLICFTLSNNKSIVDFKLLYSILSLCLDLLESGNVNIFKELTSLNVTYCKPVLRIINICLGMISNEEKIVDNNNVFLGIWKNVICKSITILFSNVRNSALSVPNHKFSNNELISRQIDDMLLILDMIRKFLSLNFTILDKQLANHFVESGAYRAIIAIYGSSHLIKVNDEEIFADYSLLFILELIKNKMIADKLVHNGIFNILVESTISLMIQRGHITPYSGNSTVVKLHQLWVERMLPIVLTLVSHFQESIIFETCQFALAFEKQTKFALHTWLESESFISSSIIEESEQLILFGKMLHMLNCYNFVSIEMNKAIEDVRLVPGLDTIEERKILLNALSYLLSHPKYLTSRIRAVRGETSSEKLHKGVEDLKNLLID